MQFPQFRNALKSIMSSQNLLMKAYFSKSKVSKPKTVKELIGPNPVRGFMINFGKIQAANPKAINLALGVPSNPTHPSIVKSKL